jgi:MFS transporter, FHS family, glucose/mannose:H+ symporter
LISDFLFLILSPVVTRVPVTFIISGFITLLASGALFASLGAFFPYLQQHFKLTESEVGLLVTLVSIGNILGSLLMGFYAARFSQRSRLITGFILNTSSLLGMSLFLGWPLILASGLLTGFGSAILTIEFNSSFATGFGDKSASMVALVGAMFSTGAILGPLLVSFNPNAPQNLYLAVTAGLLLAFGVYFFSPTYTPQAQSLPRAGNYPIVVLAWFIGFFLVQTSIEVVIGSWAPTHLIRLGSSPETSARVISIFWGLVTLARFMVVPLSLFLRPPLLVMCALTLTFILSIVAHLYTLPAYALMGFSMGPMFPLLIAWIGQRLPNAKQATAFALTGASVGAAILPPLAGKIIELSSVASIPVIVTILSLLGLAISVKLRTRA